jgi:choline transport protein
MQGLVINSQPTYVPQRWHGTLMMVAIMSVCMIFNTFLARWLPRVEVAVLVLHITLFIIVIVVLTVMSPTKAKSADVWALFSNAGGYESKGVSFFVGLITPVFAFSGADGAVHMSEEIRNSSRVVPWAMMSMCIILRSPELFG